MTRVSKRSVRSDFTQAHWRRLSLAAAVAFSILSSLSCSTATEPSNIELSSKTDKMTWEFTNACSVQVDVQLFDKTTGGVWPSPNKVWTLDGGERRVEEIKCNTNSKICFGAGVRTNYDRYWGVSLSNNQGCTDCCHTCDGSDPTAISLTSNGRC
jgi:hypothetical protein